MAGGIGTVGLIPQDLRPGIRMFWGAAYANYETEFDKLFDLKVASKRAYEEDVSLAGLGLAAVKAEGSSPIMDMGAQLFSTRYVHVKYGLGFILTKEAVDDGIALDKAELFTKSLKLSMLRTKELIAANVYVNAFSSTGNSLFVQGGDSVAMCSNAHPQAIGTLSNVPSSAASLSEAALEQAVIDIAGFTDNRNIIIKVLPKSLIIPKELAFSAKRILGSPLRSGSADNDINALRDLNSIPEVHVNHYLSSTTHWYVRTDQEGMNFFNREDMDIKIDNDFLTENLITKGTMRFSLGNTDPRAIYGVNI